MNTLSELHNVAFDDDGAAMAYMDTLAELYCNCEGCVTVDVCPATLNN